MHGGDRVPLPGLLNRSSQKGAILAHVFWQRDLLTSGLGARSSL